MNAHRPAAWPRAVTWGSPSCSTSTSPSPGPRGEGERAHLAPAALRHDLHPDGVPARVFVTHTRPAPLLGTLGPLHTGARHTAGLGFVNQGGTLTIPGLLFVNRCSWAHVVQAAASVLQMPAGHLLEKPELAALAGQRSPEGAILEPPGQSTGSPTG